MGGLPCTSPPRAFSPQPPPLSPRGKKRCEVLSQLEEVTGPDEAKSTAPVTSLKG